MTYRRWPEMRMTIDRVIEAWEDGRRGSTAGATFRTDGVNLYSYDTCVLAVVETPGASETYLVNMTRYTPTTTTHVRSVMEWLRTQGITYVGVKMPNSDFGTTPDDMRAVYYEALAIKGEEV